MGDLLKKVIKVFIFCIIFVGFTYFFWKNPTITNKIAVTITDVVDDFTSSKVNPYTRDYKINRLQITVSDYYYNKLNDNQKKIYDSIAVSVSNFENESKVKEYEYTDIDSTMNDVSEAMNAFFSDHPEVFYLNTQYKVSTVENFSGTKLIVYLDYLVKDKNELEQKISEIESAMNNILNKIDNNSNDFDKELKIHDILGELTTYYRYTDVNSIPFECHTIYGTLISNTAVCDGFTKVMQILLDKVNIDSIIVTGYLQDQPHAWNLVKINGEWYHLDLTSDKSINGKNDSEKIIIHSYFNLTTDNIKNTHTITYEDKIFSANSTNYNYYVYTNKSIGNNDNFENKFKNILDNSNNSNIVEFYAPKVLDVAGKIGKVLQNGKYTEYTSSNGNSFKYYNVLGTYILLKQK